MALSARLTVATLVIAIAGVTSGALIGQTPMLEPTSIGQATPQRSSPVIASSTRPDVRLPNHYAIETPEGRFEVEELSTRGLYRNRVGSRYDRAYEAEMDALMAELEEERAVDPHFAKAEWERSAPAVARADGPAVHAAPAPNTPANPAPAATVAVAAPAPSSTPSVTVTRASAQPLPPVSDDPLTLP